MRMRFPRRAILRCRQLSIPVCGGVAPKDSSAASIPAIAFHGCRGLPQQRDGSLGERRHERLCLVVVVLRSGQCQRRHVELQFRQREPVEQREPRYRACRALRPASAWGCFLSSCFRAAGPEHPVYGPAGRGSDNLFRRADMELLPPRRTNRTGETATGS